jgi:hypothetical protein
MVRFWTNASYKSSYGYRQWQIDTIVVGVAASYSELTIWLLPSKEFGVRALATPKQVRDLIEAIFKAEKQTVIG